MFKFFKCKHEYKEVGKYYTIVMDYECKHIMAVSVSECTVCGEQKSDIVYEETISSNSEYEVDDVIQTLEDRGFRPKLNFMLDDYKRRKNAKECLDGESQKN